MKVLQWEAECIESRARTLLNEIRRVRNKNHPYCEPLLIYDTFIDIIENEINHIKESLENYSESPTDLKNSLITSKRNVIEIVEQFNYVDRVNSSRIPFEILQPLSSVADYLVGNDNHHASVIRLDPRDAYTITSAEDLFSRLYTLDSWDEAVENAGYTHLNPSSVLLFGFPSEDAKKILHHALSAHEFGHLLANKGMIKNRLLEITEKNKGKAYRKFKSQIEDRLAEIVNRAKLETKLTGLSRSDIYNQYEKDLNKEIAEIVKDWIEETYADLVGTRLLGPAYLAALDRMLLTKSDDNPSDTHPSRSLRTHLCSILLEENQLNHFKNDPIWNEVFETCCGDMHSFNDVKYEMASESVKSALPELINLATSIQSPIDIPQKNLNELVERVEDHIMHLSPPSCLMPIDGGKSDAAGFWMILFAAWHFRLNKNKFSTFLQRYGWDRDIEKGEEALSSLVVHSLKSVEIRSHAKRPE